MAAVSIDVPAPLVDPLVDTLVALLDVKAEALHVDAEARLRHGGPRAPLLEHLTELRSVAELLAQLGWDPDPTTRRIALTGPATLLRELFESTLVSCLDRLVPTGVPSVARDRLDALEHGLDRARALVSLLRELQA